jgi:hypothetical protein
VRPSIPVGNPTLKRGVIAELPFVVERGQRLMIANKKTRGLYALAASCIVPCQAVGPAASILRDGRH